MRSSTRFKRFKSWFEYKLRKLFKLPINETSKQLTFHLSKKVLSYPPRSSFPADVLKYIKKNANPSQALKAMKTCKYFCYLKFPYLVVTYIIGNYSPSEFPGWLLYSVEEKNLQHIPTIDNIPYNLWIMEWLEIFTENNVISHLMPKIAYCECSRLILKDQNLLFNDYKMLTTSGKVIFLQFINTCVKCENGELVPFEKFFNTLPNIIEIKFEDNCAPPVLYSNDLMRLVPLSLKFIILRNPPDNFNYSIFFDFIKINSAINYNIELSASVSLKTLMLLQKLVNELVKCDRRRAIMDLQDNFDFSQTLYIRVPSV